jgi:hypothetical protein
VTEGLGRDGGAKGEEGSAELELVAEEEVGGCLFQRRGCLPERPVEREDLVELWKWAVMAG